jgi:hypothetical protein
MIIEAKKSDLEPFALLAKKKGIVFRYSRPSLSPKKTKEFSNPSPSGDVWFNSPYNLEEINKGVQDIQNGNFTKLSTKKELHDLLDSL